MTPQTAPLPTGAGARRDSFALKADQSKVPIELAISSVVIAERVLYTAIIHDLTERRNVERMKDEFVSTISHELRTPLTSIKGALGLIVAGALDSQPEKAKDMLRISFENCGRLGHLIDDLLDFEKVQLSQFSLTLQPLSINALIDKTVCANQGYAAKYGVFFGWKMPDIDVVVNGDENKLIQILSNLLSNAVKYSPKGASVTITTEILQNNIRVLIADVGSGIPLEFQDKVFEKFTQADSTDTRRVGGTGLGLAITKSLVEQHGGTISFVSEPGKGTSFYFGLPILKPGDAASL